MLAALRAARRLWDALQLTSMSAVLLASAPVCAAGPPGAAVDGQAGGAWLSGMPERSSADTHSFRTISSSRLLMLPWLEKKSESSCKEEPSHDDVPQSLTQSHTSI